jgi:hypothetical protein
MSKHKIMLVLAFVALWVPGTAKANEDWPPWWSVGIGSNGGGGGVCDAKTYDEALCFGKNALEIAGDVASAYTSLTKIPDMWHKLSQLLGWEAKPLSLMDVLEGIQSYTNRVSSDIKTQASLTTISGADSFASLTIEHLVDRESQYRDLDEPRSHDAAFWLADPESWGTVFLRDYDLEKDAALIKLLNATCVKGFPFTYYPDLCWGDDRHTREMYQPGYGSWVDLHPPHGSKTSVYDWRIALPSLMNFISTRLQFLASTRPGYFLDPYGDPGKRNELKTYRDALYKHYYYILSGIRCFDQSCTEIHSGTSVAWRDELGAYALYGGLPLHEIKSLIDTLYLYMHSPQADLTQTYHRLSSYIEPDWCLTTKRYSRFETGVVMDICDGRAEAQQWVYDRRSGRVRNTGSVATGTLASGGCLGVGEVVGLGLVLGVNVRSCEDGDRRQLWTYDPETHVLLNAMGTALSINWNDSGYRVRSEPYDTLVYGKDPEDVANCHEMRNDQVDKCLKNLPLTKDPDLVKACQIETYVPKDRQAVCIAQLPMGVPNPPRYPGWTPYRDSPAVTWRADQIDQIAPGVAAPFSSGLVSDRKRVE